jgi:hypothetical protein
MPHSIKSNNIKYTRALRQQLVADRAEGTRNSVEEIA